MHIEADLPRSANVVRLVTCWRQLYRLNPSILPKKETPALNEWIAAASPEGRAATVEKLNESFLRIRCQLAGIETSDLYSYMPRVLDCNELRRLAEVSLTLYQEILKLYQHQFPLTTTSLTSLLNMPSAGLVDVYSIPRIEELIAALEPKLLEFQMFHQRAKDWRSVGFLTTQLNFCNNWLLKSLTLPEQQLVTPYLMFLEEYAAHPWQRVCAAAARYDVAHPALELAEQMIPEAEGIAANVYQQLLKVIPNHASRRGTLAHPGVKHSCLRDLKMFQAYLWLCILQQNMAAIETELVSLCLMVLPSVSVKWELIDCWLQALTDEIHRQIKPSQHDLVLPYTKRMQQAFVRLYNLR